MGNEESPDAGAMVSDAEDGHTDGLERPLSDIGVGAVVAEATRPWRGAEALKALRKQVDAAYPGRNRANDGMIGDAAHQSRKSDHNPWLIDGTTGVVTAIDITHDPAKGCDANRIVAALHASRDKRIKYLIWNRRIANSADVRGVPAWTWRAYTGTNPHDHHFHLSVHEHKALYDDTSAWAFQQIAEAAAASPAADAEGEVLSAMMALGLPVEAGAPALPQLVAWQDALSRLRTSLAQAWCSRDRGVEPEAAPDFASLRASYEQLFATATLRPEWKSTVGWYLKMLRRGRARYEQVEAATRAPWWFVGIVHAMEASFSFAAHLHNGDPLSARTVQVPRNRPPPPWTPPGDWLGSAIDAITYQGHADQTDWSLARALHRFEGYNGFGYYAKGIHSPYLWSFTNHYSKGKFMRDHRYAPDFVSKQCGTAAMLRALVDAGDVVLDG